MWEGVTERTTGECRSRGRAMAQAHEGLRREKPASCQSRPLLVWVGNRAGVLAGPTSLGESPCEGPGWAGADGEPCPESSDADPAQEPPRQRTATKTASRPSEGHLTLILFPPSVALFLQGNDRRNCLSWGQTARFKSTPCYTLMRSPKMYDLVESFHLRSLVQQEKACQSRWRDWPCGHRDKPGGRTKPGTGGGGRSTQSPGGVAPREVAAPRPSVGDRRAGQVP